MRQSLAGAAARGMSTASISRQKRKLLEAGDIEGLMALNGSLYGSAVMVADPEDEADEGDDDTDESDDPDDDDDADADDEGEDEGEKKPDPKSRRIQELAAESKKHRLKARDYRRERDEARAELEKLKQGKGKPAPEGKEKDSSTEDEGDDASAELKAQNQKLQEQLMTQQLRSSFTDLTTGSKPIAQFKNPKTAFKLLDLDDVEIVDGEIEGLEDAIKALVKSDPYLLVSKDESDDEDEVTERRRRRTTGQPTGGRSKQANPEREKLVSKYPALRR